MDTNNEAGMTEKPNSRINSKDFRIPAEKKSRRPFEGCVYVESDRLRFAIERSRPWLTRKPWDCDRVIQTTREEGICCAN
jgi:hypothetical protein